ncbi:hypothetical protein OROHE_025047 [Orobanche hederae]
MPTQSAFKLLEINVISAQDLPPVSKMLRTFAVAYVRPDNKLTTRIDHQGHTNPTWNYKIAFHVDDKFLKNESSVVTIEIYNLAWLRDLPIGTARLVINSLSPNLLRNPGFRRVSIRICRPSGHLQGILNLGVQLVENYVIPGCGISHNEELYEEDGMKDENQERSYSAKEEDLQNPGPARVTSLSRSPESRTTSRPESEPETKTVATSAGSLYSVMRPLPSEVAADLKKGVYSAEWNDYGSSIFEDWTEQGNKSEDLVAKPRNMQWAPVIEDRTPLTADEILPDDGHRKRRPDKKNNNNKKKGLFSCFGNAYGFQFSFFCGSKGLKKKKKKKKNRNVNKQNIHLMSLPEENLPRYYV